MAPQDALLAVVGRFRLLEDLLRWGAAQSPPGQVVDVVVQDEYTHDVIFTLDNQIYLVFDST